MEWDTAASDIRVAVFQVGWVGMWGGGGGGGGGGCCLVRVV